jgi:hypothetical protein
MARYQVGTLIDLGNREAVSLDDVKGSTLSLLSGTIWVTQHDDPEDIVLDRGADWVVERDGRTVLQAQDDALVYVIGRGIKPIAKPWRGELTQRHGWWTHLLSLHRTFVPYL